jgi:hypothetical protein
MENKLKAGAGKAEILFPEAMFPVEGFSGIHDNPHIRVLLLEAGEKAAIVSMEIVMSPPEINQWMTEYLQEKCGVPKENVWIHVTHAITTPHAPGGPLIGPGGRILPPPPDMGMMPYPDKIDVEHRRLYTEAVKQAAKQAMDDAMETLQEAVYGVGTGTCDVNANRDVETKMGWWIGLGGNGLSNKTMTVIQFHGTDGNIIASLMSYGIKPCAIDNSQMRDQARRISSDVPGLACRMLEEKTQAPVLFCMSAAGDQIPKEQTWYDVVDENGEVKTIDLGVENGLKLVHQYGTQMGEDAIRIANSITDYRGCTKIDMEQGSISWNKKKRTEMKVSRTPQYEPEETGEIPWYLMTMGNVAFAATRPELCAITEQQIVEQSEYEHTLLVTMVNGGMKYMPDKISYENNTWEAQNSMFMPGAAEAYVAEITKKLKRMN